MRRIGRIAARLVLTGIMLLAPSSAIGETRLVLKSARQASTYYAFAVAQANAIMAGAPNR